jgi:hypothetical protein
VGPARVPRPRQSDVAASAPELIELVFNIDGAYIERMVNGISSLAEPSANGIVRREQIRAAAYELAAESGLRAITIRGVAQRAGLSTGLVLFHYGSKQRLVLGVLDWVLETTIALCQEPAVAH